MRIYIYHGQILRHSWLFDQYSVPRYLMWILQAFDTCCQFALTIVPTSGVKRYCLVFTQEAPISTITMQPTTLSLQKKTWPYHNCVHSGPEVGLPISTLCIRLTKRISTRQNKGREWQCVAASIWAAVMADAPDTSSRSWSHYVILPHLCKPLGHFCGDRL
jgi:hypothetical protein